MMDIKKQYQFLKKKYKLPDYEELNFELELDSLDESEFLLRKIRKRIQDRIESFVKILEEILQPETTLSGLHECKFFDDNEKKELYELYKKLMVILRHGLQLSIHNDEKEDAVYINDVFKQWSEFKNQLSDCVNKIKESWKKETDTKQDPGYFG